ncbi:MAG: hypothetical protein IT340_10690 [Chloroflexi bacterium]|nr:hypothetical protein [Chloroflexota bacterium]
MLADQPLRHASEPDLAHTVEDNLYALFRAMARLSGSELVEDAAGSRHLAPPTNPMYKGVWRTRLRESDADQAIDETIAWFRERQAPFFFWWTGPDTTPTDLGQRLVARGLLSMEAQMDQLAAGIRSTALGAPGMVADLTDMQESALTTVPDGLTITDVADDLDLADFIAVLVAGYAIPAPLADGWAQAARAFGLGRTPWRMILGRLHGRPVATTMLFNGGGVASVYGVATVPDARGQGIGGAITLAPLLQARDAGYRYAALFASDEGVGAYRRIGFRLTNVRINRFLWRNS